MCSHDLLLFAQHELFNRAAVASTGNDKDPSRSSHHEPVVPSLPHGQQDELPLGCDVRVPAAVEARPLGLPSRQQQQEQQQHQPNAIHGPDKDR